MRSTAEVVRDLRSRDYRLSGPGYVSFLIREGHLVGPEKKAGTTSLWSETDVDRLRWTLERRGRGPGQEGRDRS